MKVFYIIHIVNRGIVSYFIFLIFNVILDYIFLVKYKMINLFFIEMCKLNIILFLENDIIKMYNEKNEFEEK